MKLIIDIPEDVRIAISSIGLLRIPDEMQKEVDKAIQLGKPISTIKFTNSEWVDFLSKQFDISRTSAKEMLHAMMSVKREDNFKKQFSGRK